MEQRTFGEFKEMLRQWMLENPQRYVAFESMMTEQNDDGYLAVCSSGALIIPQFFELVQFLKNDRGIITISDIVNKAKEAGVAEVLLSLFEDKEESTIPAMLAWLFWGRSFEGMLERGERISKDPNADMSVKMMVAQGCKLLIDQSLNLGLRTKEDWDRYKEMYTIINSDNIIDFALSGSGNNIMEMAQSFISEMAEVSEEEEEEDNIPIEATEGDFSRMLTIIPTKREALLGKVRSYMESGVKGKTIAFMIIALRDLYYLAASHSNRMLFDAIRSEFGQDIGSDKGIYYYMERDQQIQKQREIAHVKAYFKVD